MDGWINGSKIGMDALMAENGWWDTTGAMDGWRHRQRWTDMHGCMN